MGRFLLLEDDRNQQRALARRLEGHRPVDLAQSISEARLRLSTGGPYVGYVFDVNLPDGNGIDFLRELRARADEATPAVVITAMPIDRELAARVSAIARLLPKVGADIGAGRFLEGLDRFIEEALDYERLELGPRAILFDMSDGELTATQMDVAVMGVLGYSRAEIAARLGITVHTARSHIRDVLMKTGMRGQSLSALARAVTRHQRGG